MTTVNKPLTAGADWVEVTTAEDFLVQNVGSSEVMVCFAASAPTGDHPHHYLMPNTGLSRNGVTGNVYAKATNGGQLAVS